MKNNGTTEESIENTGFKDVPKWLDEHLFLEFLENDFLNFHKITKFIVKPAVQTGENYMTVMLRVAVEIELNDSTKTSTSYMIKIQPIPEKLQQIIKDSQIFFKEHTTYVKYVPAFEKFYQKAGRHIKLAPHLLEPTKSDINDDFIILEDLRPKGFKNFNRHLGLDLLHTKAVLQKLAQFHASSAHFFNKHGPYPKIYEQSITTGKESFDGHRMKVNKMFRDHLHLYGDFEYLEEKLKIYAENQSKLKRDVNLNGFNVLNHGDCWTNNIMFQYDEHDQLKETFLIDLQMCRYGSPAQDLLYFLLSSTNLEVKLRHFDYFIHYYHQQLTDHLKLISYKGKMPTLREIHVDLLKHDYWAYQTVSMIMPIILCESRDDANVDTLISERNDDLRRFMYSNSLYVKNMNILLPWLNNRGTFDV